MAPSLVWFISKAYMISNVNSSHSNKDELCPWFWTTVDRMAGAEEEIKKVLQVMCMVLKPFYT